MIPRLKHLVSGAIILTIVLIAMVFAAIIFPFQTHQFEKDVTDITLLLNTLVQRDTEHLANEIFDKRLTAINIRIKEMKTVNGILGITVFDHEGKRLRSNSPIEAGQLHSRERDMIRKKANIRQDRWQKNDILVFSKEIRFLDEHLGFIRIDYSLREVKQARKAAYWILGGLLCAISLIMLVLLNWIIDKAILKPMTELRDTAHDIAQGNLDKSIHTDRRDELGNLADSFEAMRLAVTGKISDLSRLQNYLSNIIDAMPSALVGVDKKGRVTQWNQAAEQYYGLGPDQAKGKPLEKVIPSLAQNMEQITVALTRQDTLAITRAKRQEKDGLRYEDITLYPLIQVKQTDLEGAVIRIDDITQKVHLEDMMIQTEKMMSVGGLAAGMAHEINNPLAGIIQNTQVLTNRMTRNTVIKANETAAKKAGITMDAIEQYMISRNIPNILNAISQSGRRIAIIVNNMLEFARKGDTIFIEHNLPDLMDRSLELAQTDFDLKKHFDFKSIAIEKVYQDNLPNFFCDGNKIQQVLLNILSNGAHAMADMAHPRLVLKLSVEKQATMVKIEIQDNGPGMDEETQKRIFEPFFTTKSVGLGTGLGLSISYFIITEHHCGTMDVTSEPDKGTTFIIRLPVQGREYECQS